MKWFLPFVVGIFLSPMVPAQQFGGNPASIKWRQINTDTVRVIFPRGFDAKALRIASVVHYLQKNYATTIGGNIRKVNIVIQDQTLVSNGYVGLAPYRSEFYVTPPQNAFELGAVNWTDNLAVHEFRHVQQYSNFNTGLSKVASFILGEQGQAVANAAAVPDWFFEGDAVYNETKLTQQGRGTLPFFMSSYQTLFNANRKYTYEKMRNGSLRQYVPDHYDLGYLLVAYGRKKYGNDIWRKVTADAVAFKPLFYPFQGAVKKYTGISFPDFVNQAMAYYQAYWQSSANEKINWVTKADTNNVTNYKYPYRAGDGSLIVLKNSYRTIPAFYKINADNIEEKIAVRDIAVDDYFSYNNGKIVYTSFQPDLRWGNRDYNAIKILNIQTGETTKIAGYSKYFSPDISQDGSKIVAAELKPLMEPRVVLLDMKGQLLDSFSKKGIIFSNPKFSADGQYYYVVARNIAGGMSLLKNAINNNKLSETLLSFTNRIIGFLNVQGDTLLFTSTYQGRDEIWAIIDGKERKGPFRLASYSTGLYQAVLQPGGTLTTAAFTADGYRLGNFPANWEPVEIKDELSTLYIDSLFKKEDHLMLDKIPEQLYDISKYPKSFHLLNIHSFRPNYQQPEYSFTLYGQNVLNTLQTQIAYTYNQNEGSHQLGYNGIYGGTYLQPVFGINQTWHRTVDLTIANRDSSAHWNEFSGYAGLQLPLNLSDGKQYRYLTALTTFNTDQVQWTGFAKSLLVSQHFNYFTARIQYTGQIQQAAQQIYPHWAQSLLVQYKSILNNYTAHQWLISGALYLPGISNSHSLVVTAAAQGRDTLRQYFFSDNFPFSRGYTAVDFPSMWKFGANYHFPLAYPDKGFGNIVYFQRIRVNLFYDYAIGKSIQTGISYPFNTAGVELYFDTKWWNQQAVSFGIRYSRLLNNEFRGTTYPNVWELILPVNLFN
jgi:hypothetical protein